MSLEKEDETDPEALEEAGILEADVGAHLYVHTLNIIVYFEFFI